MSDQVARPVTPETVRRLAVTRQRLAGPQPPADREAVLSVVRDLRCLQLDPTSAVARSHLLVLWSRLGPYDRHHLDRLLWHDRLLFEYWAHAASIVLTEDYPIHSTWMRHYLAGDDRWTARITTWLAENASLRQHIMDSIRQNGPLSSRAFEDRATVEWYSSGWTSNRNISKMLSLLWEIGDLVVAGRQGGARLWDLSERFLPDWTPRAEWSWYQTVQESAQHALRALGIATARQIQQHFTRSRYPDLSRVLHDLQHQGRVLRVLVQDDAGAWPGVWYIHADDLPLLDQLETGAFEPRTTLLSPFDNLICDRGRTAQLFGFDFRIEIYVPRDRRRYGYFVLPILFGDRLIGRIDPLMDRRQATLRINAVYAEPGAPLSAGVGRQIAASITSLAAFLGARQIEVAGDVPSGWARPIRSL